METILFKNEKFVGRYVNFDFGERLVSVDSLEQILLDNGEYINEEARIVDEQIFYYVQDSEIMNNEKSLAIQILSEL